MKRSQWFVLSGGFFIISLYFYMFWAAVVPSDTVECVVKHSVYGSIFQIAFIFAMLFFICGSIERTAEKRKK